MRNVEDRLRDGGRTVLLDDALRVLRTTRMADELAQLVEFILKRGNAKRLQFQRLHRGVLEAGTLDEIRAHQLPGPSEHVGCNSALSQHVKGSIDSQVRAVRTQH